MDHLFIAPTFMCAATIVASLDDPQYAEGRRGLLITNNSAMPEISDGLAGLPGFSSLADHFDSVLSLNEVIAPFHPRSYGPRGERLTEIADEILERLGLSSDVTITAQSIHVKPTAVLLRALPDAPIHAVSDGLMSYGPTRIELPRSVHSRIERLIYLDLIEDVEPLLLTEYDVPRSPLAPERFQRVVEEYAARAVEEGLHPTVVEYKPEAVILGQYLSDLNLLTPEQEQEHHVRMLDAAVALGAKNILFKPHPSAPNGPISELLARAADQGVRLEVYNGPMPIEALLGHWHPRHVIGSFSTGLATAKVLKGIDTVTVGCPEVAVNLPKFRDSNRIPLLASFLTSPDFTTDGAEGQLVDAPAVDVSEALGLLAAAMQPDKVDADQFTTTEADYLRAHPTLLPFFTAESRDEPLKRPSRVKQMLATRPRVRKAVSLATAPVRVTKRQVKRARKVGRSVVGALRHDLPE